MNVYAMLPPPNNTAIRRHQRSRTTTPIVRLPPPLDLDLRLQRLIHPASFSNLRRLSRRSSSPPHLLRYHQPRPLPLNLFEPPHKIPRSLKITQTRLYLALLRPTQCPPRREHIFRIPNPAC